MAYPYTPYGPRGPYTPYAPQVRPAQQPPRSGTALTLGILSVCFGTLWVLRHVLDFVAAAAFEWLPSMLGSVLSSLYPAHGATDDAVRTLAIFFAARGGLMILASAALLVMGIGLIGQREWARRWSIYWSCVAFVVLAARFVTWRAAVLPAITAAAEEQLSAVLPGLPRSPTPSRAGWAPRTSSASCSPRTPSCSSRCSPAAACARR
jgi:hypothetical protein